MWINTFSKHTWSPYNETKLVQQEMLDYIILDYFYSHIHFFEDFFPLNIAFLHPTAVLKQDT